MKTKPTYLRFVVTLCVAALAQTIAAPISHARGGKDDPAGHNTGDDRGGNKKPAKPAAKKANAPHKVDGHGKHGAGHK